MSGFPTLHPLGDAAATLRFGVVIDSGLNARAHAFCAALKDLAPPGLIEWAPAFASVTLWYDPDVLGFAELEFFCRGLAASAQAPAAGVSRELPFCVEGEGFRA